jgi:aminobenzoyl-glutamate utilization protein B
MTSSQQIGEEADTYDAKEHALKWVDDNEEWLSEFHEEIWEYAEPAWREYETVDAYVELLRDEGFEVEEGSGDMPTAFVAEYSHGSGEPVIATYAEYDAVPENNQKPVPRKEPRDGYHPYAAGHTDPHSALGVGALGGALATKSALEEFDVDGKIRLFGEPAEKVCGSKPVHAAKGYFDENDAHISFHPYSTNTALWDTHSGSYWNIVFEFEAENPQEWSERDLIPQSGTSHAEARCPGAIDAVCLMYTNTKYTKEAMFPHTGTWTLNEYIMTAGQKTSDNLTPRISQIQYSFRSPTLDIQERILDVLRNNAQQAADATSCTVNERWVAKTRIGLANHAITQLTYNNLELVGAPEYDEEAREFGRQIQENLGMEPMDDPFDEGAQQLLPPQEYEKKQRKSLPEWQDNFSSDDYVDYTWHAPTVRLYTGRPRLKPPEDDPEYSYPEWTYNALGGVPEVIDPGTFVGSKTIAATMLDLMTKPEALARAQEEFEERTGGGVGGDDWVPPLLSEDYIPPVDLPWPEYVEREGEREWYMPTPWTVDAMEE